MALDESAPLLNDLAGQRDGMARNRHANTTSNRYTGFRSLSQASPA